MKLFSKLFWFALATATVIAICGHWLTALFLLGLVSSCMTEPEGCCRAVTLSVPELLAKLMDAFKLETPELFGSGLFARNFSTSTAVLGDKITARISHVPVSGNYDANNGGFAAAQQDVTTLLEDVSIYLNQFSIVTVKLPWLERATSKVRLDDAAIPNLGYAMANDFLGRVLTAARSNVSHFVNVNVNLFSLDTWDGTLRNQLNSQKAAKGGRWALINTALANQLGADDRIRSSLFYNQRNGENGFRSWTNLGGFKVIREWNDINRYGLAGLMGDPRLIVCAVRKIEDVSNVADQLGIPKVMEFYPIEDPVTGLSMTGVTWQEAGTGDTYFSVALLAGFGVGNMGGPSGTVVDNAGCQILAS